MDAAPAPAAAPAAPRSVAPPLPDAALPLHCAAAARASAEDVAALLAAHPGAAATEDSHGMLPLHHACAHGAPAAAVAALLAAHAAGARVRAAGGMLPLHWACEGAAAAALGAEDAAATVAALLEAAPEAATSPDRLGRLPLHAAAGGGAPLGAVRALLAAHRRGSAELDGAGRTPAHAAAAAGAASYDTLALLLDVYPQARGGRASAWARRGRARRGSAAAPPKSISAHGAAGCACVFSAPHARRAALTRPRRAAPRTPPASLPCPLPHRSHRRRVWRTPAEPRRCTPPRRWAPRLPLSPPSKHTTLTRCDARSLRALYRKRPR
jgi:ankyrin repeat protein